jgi:t-SNARE complex subunit (syntaxin)
MTDAITHATLPVPAKLIPFNIPIMNHEEENTQREERYRISQDDVSIIRKEVNKLTEVVGDLTQAVRDQSQALRGNDFGGKGLVERVDDVEEMAKALTKKIDDIIAHAKSRETYIRIIWGLICFVVGTIFVAIIDRLIPSVKSK